MPKFTFRRQARTTGLASVANPVPSVNIKLNGKTVGHINPPNLRSPQTLWSVSFMIESDDQPGGWCWRRLVQKFENEEAARQWLNDNATMLQKHKLYSDPDE